MEPSYDCPSLLDSCSEAVATVAKCSRLSNQFSGMRLAGLNGSMEVTVAGVVSVNSISDMGAEDMCTHMHICCAINYIHQY